MEAPSSPGSCLSIAQPSRVIKKPSPKKSRHRRTPKNICYPCTTCGKAYHSGQALGGHKNTHTRERRRLMQEAGLRSQAVQPQAQPAVPAPAEAPSLISHPPNFSYRSTHHHNPRNHEISRSRSSNFFPFARLNRMAMGFGNLNYSNPMVERSPIVNPLALVRTFHLQPYPIMTNFMGQLDSNLLCHPNPVAHEEPNQAVSELVAPSVPNPKGKGLMITHGEEGSGFMIREANLLGALMARPGAASRAGLSGDGAGECAGHHELDLRLRL